MTAILNRRSVRRFTGEPPTQAEVQTLLKAASYAPSGHDRRAWHFIVVDDPKMLDAFARHHQYMQMMPKAGFAIVVCADTEACPEMWKEDCAAATQNILLAATSLGLGSCWCGIGHSPEHIANFRKLLQLPDSIVPFSGIAIGHPKYPAKEVSERFDSAKVHHNTW